MGRFEKSFEIQKEIFSGDTETLKKRGSVGGKVTAAKNADEKKYKEALTAFRTDEMLEDIRKFEEETNQPLTPIDPRDSD